VVRGQGLRRLLGRVPDVGQVLGLADVDDDVLGAGVLAHDLAHVDGFPGGYEESPTILEVE